MNKAVLLEHIKRGFLDVKSLISTVILTTTEAIDELQEVKLDRPNAISVSISNVGWKRDSNIYPNYYDITEKGLTASDIAEVVIAPSSLNIAKACGLSPVCETLDNTVRIRAASIPNETIIAEYWIVRGRKEA